MIPPPPDQNKERRSYTPIHAEELECLVMWPKGSNGERNERLLLHTLLRLAEEHGYGRLAQLTTQMEDLWRHPKNRTMYEKGKKDHLDMLKNG